MIKYDNLTIKGIDVSQYNGTYTDTKLPQVSKFKDMGGRFIIIRSSYGRVADRAYPFFVKASKGVLDIALYHYMDYYSHTSLGITSSQWGIKQAEKIWELNRENNYPVFIDVESASVATNIANVWPTAMTILDNILQRYDELSGKTTGIYASTGWLPKFYDYHRSRPLFAANYNPLAPDQIRSIVSKSGFTNLLIWQYSSTGNAGFSSPCDMNAWMQDEDCYRQFFSSSPVVMNPNPEPEPEPVKTRLVDIKTVQVGTLNIRRGAGTNFGIVGTLVRGNVVECLEYKTVNGNTWARVGQSQWVAAVYNGQNYIA